MILTGIPLMLFLIYAVLRLNRKPKTPPEPKPGKVSAIIINSNTGEIETKTITADWKEYARTIDADTITIGARGKGYVVMVNERLNSFSNFELSSGFTIMGKVPKTFKGMGLVLPTGADPEGLQVEIYTLGSEATVIHSIGI